MGISEPMPVITRIITAESGSRRSVNAASKSPDRIQLKTYWTIARDSPSCCNSRNTAASDTAKAPAIAPTATAPDADFARRRPTLALTRNPSSGSSGISNSMTAQRSGARRLPFQHRERFGVQRLTMAKQRDHDRQADRRLGRRDGHHEEHDDLSVSGAQRAAERDECQVHRVQHDLDRQQNRDQVPPHEPTGRANREQDRRQDQVIVEGRHHRTLDRPGASSRRASITAPTSATRMRIDVTSNANA